jgi:Pectate lyase superfamily protein
MRLILALFISLFASAAQAQNTTCATRPPGDNSNACASTSFVQGAVSGVGAITSLTGPVTGTGPGATATTIAPGVVTNSNLANVAATTVKGSVAGGTPADLTVAQLQGFARGIAISVTDPAYGAKCDGVTNDATAFNAAITAANALTPGGRVIVPPGVCIVGAALGGSASAVLSNIDLVGSGMGATTIKLANTSNVNVIDGDSSLFGSASNSGVSFFRLSDMTIDGNKANNTSGSCVAIYGWRINMINLRLQNCANHGLRTEYTGNALDRVNNYLNVLIDTVGNHGWWNNGPQDSNADTIIIVDAGQATNNTWDGILIDTAGGMHSRHLHPYHRAAATNRMKFAIEDNGGGSNISDSNFEGANIPAQINSSKNTYINNAFYAAWNGAGTLIVKQPENVIVGFLGDPGAGRPATKGLLLGTGADNAAVNMIDLVTSAQTLGAIDFTNSAGFNQIRIKGFAATGPGYVGVPTGGDNVEVDISGTPTSLPHLIQKPGKQSSSGAAPAFSACGTSPAITGSDHAGVFQVGTGTTTCTLTFNAAFANPPACVVTSQTTTPPAYTRSSSQIILSTVVASAVYHYICIGQAGG